MIDESLGRLTKCALAWQGTTFASDVNALVAELERLRAELETERMRLAACGVVALANTTESASKARKMLLKYRSASLDDVKRAVDEQMRLRTELAKVRRDAERYRWLRDSKIADDADRWICAHECTVHEVAELDGERLDAAIDRARGAE